MATYLVVENNLITNIVVFDEDTKPIGSQYKPYYEGAEINSPYNPPTFENNLANLVIDQEYRLTLLELGIT